MPSGLLLVGATDKYQLITSSAAAIDVVASFIDITTAGVVTPKSPQLTKTSSATTTDIVATPASTDIRSVTGLTVYNADATLACDVSIILDRSGTDYVLWKTTLNAGEMLEYTEATAFYKFAPAARLDMLRYVTADSVHATAATFADVTGLQFPVTSGRTYTFDCFLMHFGNAATTGAQFAVGGVAMTLIEMGALSTLVKAVTGPTLSAGIASAINTAVIVQVDSSITRCPTWFNGFFQPSASGTMAIRATSEVTVGAGLTITKGSWCHVRETNN